MFLRWFMSALALAFVAAFSPLPGSAATPELSVAQITHGGLVVMRADDVILRSLTGDVLRKGLQAHDALPREVQVDVPAGDTIVVSVAQRSKTSTATLLAGSRSTFWNTGTIEMVAVRGGKVDFDDPLSFFRVSAQSVTLSHHLTKFSVDVEGGRTSVECTQDSVDVSLNASISAGVSALPGNVLALGFARRVDTVAAHSTSHVVYTGRAGDMHADVPFARDLAAAATGDPRAEYNAALRLEHGNGVTKNVTAAMRYYRLAAQKRFPAAENYLGYQYSLATPGRHPDYALALQLLTRAVADGNRAAKANLGYLYWRGLGVTKSVAHAVTLYRAGAEQGDGQAENNLGVAYNLGSGVPRDYIAARRLYMLAAAQGVVTALNNLGYLYNDGLGVELDYHKALSLYRQAAEHGDQAGENDVGWMYANGEGVARDYKAALFWYRKSAAQGAANSENNIGALYDSGGPGLPQDSSQALHWYHLAAAHGYVGAENNIGFMYAIGRPGLPQNYRIAREWLNEGAAKGDDTAQDTLGIMYLRGYGVSKDRARGLHLVELSAEQGYPRAQQHLGSAYQFGGDGEKPDYEKALYWYKLSAEQSWPPGQYLLGKMYALGLGVKQDYSVARMWYERAAKQSMGQAEFALGDLYEHGLGVAADTATALHWYELALQHGDDEAKAAIKRLSPKPSPTAIP